MRVWRVTLDDGSTVDVPADRVLNPVEMAAGREGYGVYEAVAGDGHVLYTGRTRDLGNRLRSHSTRSPWWAFAAEIRWTPCADYSEAVALERVGISTEASEWNLHGRTALAASERTPLPVAMTRRVVALYAAADERFGRMDLANYIATGRSLGWTLQAFASALSITREAVRLIGEQGGADPDLFIPRPPQPLMRTGKVWPRLSPAITDEMRRLLPLAQRVRGGTAIDHPNRQAGERLSELMAEARLRGVRDREIAETLGISRSAVRLRLGRYGYTKNPPSQPSYNPGSHRNAAPDCSRGHALFGENVRFINGDPDRRVCRTCERIRVAAYRTRKRRADAEALPRAG